jgi:hypothetical protein
MGHIMCPKGEPLYDSVQTIARQMEEGMAGSGMNGAMLKRFGLDEDGNVISGGFVDTVRAQMVKEGLLTDHVTIRIKRKPRSKPETFRCPNKCANSRPSTQAIGESAYSIPKCAICGSDKVKSFHGRRMLDDYGKSNPEPGTAMHSKPDTTPYDEIASTLITIAEVDGGELRASGKELQDLCGGQFSKAAICRTMRRYGIPQIQRKANGKPSRKYEFTADLLRRKMTPISDREQM